MNSDINKEVEHKNKKRKKFIFSFLLLFLACGSLLWYTIETKAIDTRPASTAIFLGNGSSNTTKKKTKYIDIDLTGGVSMSQKPSVAFYSVADNGGQVYNSIAPPKGTRLISMTYGKEYYYSQGGSVSGQWENNKKKTFTLNNVDVTCMTPHFRLPKVSKTGYTFTGWSITKTENNYSLSGKTWKKLATSNKGVKYGNDGFYYVNIGAYSNIRTVKPNFKINNYTLYFNANGGSVSPSSRSVTYGSQYGTLPTPTRTGYTFNGWYTTSSGGSRVSNTTTMGASNTTIYAHWTPNNYYLDLNGILDGVSRGNISGFGTADIYVNGNLVGNDVTDYYTAHPYGSSYSISDIKSLTGKRYDGVYSGSTSGTILGNTSTTLSFSTINYANTISHWMFGFRNGEGNNGNKSAWLIKTTSFSQPYNSKYTMDSSRGVTVPKGFNLAQSFGTSSINGSWTNYNFGTQVTQKANNMSFEYDYFPLNYNITYNLDGGTNNSSNPSTYNILYGVTLQNPTREGYKFVGWYNGSTKITGINQGANATFTSESDMYNKLNSRTIGDITLTAKWLPIRPPELILKDQWYYTNDNVPMQKILESATATDKYNDTIIYDEDIINKIKINSVRDEAGNSYSTTGTLDTTQARIYAIHFSVTNKYGLKDEGDITVEVIKKDVKKHTYSMRFISKKYINSLSVSSIWKNGDLFNKLNSSLNKEAKDTNAKYIIELSNEECENIKNEVTKNSIRTTDNIKKYIVKNN